MTLISTGLRRGELASLTVGQLRLDDDPATIELNAADEKTRRATIRLRDDLAGNLREWLRDKLATVRRESLRRGEPVPSVLPSEMKLFRVPIELVKILDRDMRHAGIAKIDDRGHVVDVHAMRKTFGTRLAKAGVPLRTSQELMRIRPETNRQSVHRSALARHGRSD